MDMYFRRAIRLTSPNSILNNSFYTKYNFGIYMYVLVNIVGQSIFWINGYSEFTKYLEFLWIFEDFFLYANARQIVLLKSEDNFL